MTQGGGNGPGQGIRKGRARAQANWEAWPPASRHQPTFLTKPPPPWPPFLYTMSEEETRAPGKGEVYFPKTRNAIRCP